MNNRSNREHRRTTAPPQQLAREGNLMAANEDELERRYVEGYRRKPEDPAWGEATAKVTAEVWPKEDWIEMAIRRGRAAPPKNRKKRKPRTTL